MRHITDWMTANVAAAKPPWGERRLKRAWVGTTAFMRESNPPHSGCYTQRRRDGASYGTRALE